MRSILLSIILLMSISWTINAQSITYSANQKSIISVLDDISAQYNLFFSYSNNSMPAELISISSENERLDIFLNKLLRPHRLGFQFVESNFIAIKPVGDIGVQLSLTVVAADDKVPLGYALLKESDTFKGAHSNLNGSLNYYMEEPGEKTIEISYVGFEPFKANAVDLYVNQIDTIFLKPDQILLEGIVVTEYLNSGITVSENGSQLSLYPDDSNVIPGLSEPDPLYSLQQLPGISSSNESASDLNIRGSGSDQVAIYWDDIPVYHSAHYFGLVSSFVPASVSRMNIYRNAIPTQYGGSAAGLIDLDAPYYNPLKATYQFDANMTHLNGSAIIPTKNEQLYLYVSGRRSINDYYITPTYSAYDDKLFNGSRLNESRDIVVEEEFDSKNKIQFWDINTKLVFDLSPDQRFSTSFFSGTNVLDFQSVNAQLETADFQKHDVDHLGLNAGWSANWNSIFSTDVTASYSQYKLDYQFLFQREINGLDEAVEKSVKLRSLDDHEDEDEDSEEDEEFEEEFENAPDSLSDNGFRNNDLRNLELRLVNSLSLKKGVIKFGAQYNRLDISYRLREENSFSPDVDENFNEKGNGFGIFGSYTYKPDFGLIFDTGFRYNYFEYAEVQTLDPQISLSYSVNSWLRFKASATSQHQIIRTLSSFENTISNNSEEIWFSANVNDFPIIRNLQTNAGFIIQSKGWLLDVDAYLKKLDGLTSANYNFGGNLNNEFINGEEYIRGIDILLRKRFKRYRTWISYTYSEAESFFAELSDERFTSALDRPHTLSISQSLTLNRIELSLGWTYKTGLPYSEPISDVAFRNEIEDDNDADTNIEVFYTIEYDNDAFNSQRLPDYHRLDASIWYYFSFRQNPDLRGKIGLSVLNLYNQKNIFSRTFVPDRSDLNEDEVEVFQEDRFLLGFTPNLTFSISF